MQPPVPLSLLEALPLDLVMWAIIALLAVCFVVYTAILLWHWNVYSTGKFTTISTTITYLAVSGGFFVLMGMSAVWYALS
jgi:uncharacterized membrane protein